MKKKRQKRSSTSIYIYSDLLIELERLAKKYKRPRNQVIEMILTAAVNLHPDAFESFLEESYK